MTERAAAKQPAAGPPGASSQVSASPDAAAWAAEARARLADTDTALAARFDQGALHLASGQVSRVDDPSRRVPALAGALQRLRIAPADRHPYAFFQKLPRRLPADAAACAGHDRRAALDAQIHGVFLAVVAIEMEPA